jgi:Helix-turn-helix domain
MPHHLRIRDIRARPFFWCDNTIIDQYARLLGPYALAVYVALVRHADSRTQSCYPSYATLAEELAISRNSVRQAVKTLLKYKLIARKRRRSPDGDPASNLYFLLGVGRQMTHLGHQMTHGRSYGDLGVGHQEAPNNTHLEQDTENKGEAAFRALKMNGSYGLCATCQTWHQPGPCP